jgi:hypothetical protein
MSCRLRILKLGKEGRGTTSLHVRRMARLNNVIPREVRIWTSEQVRSVTRSLDSCEPSRGSDICDMCEDSIASGGDSGAITSGAAAVAGGADEEDIASRAVADEEAVTSGVS